MKRVTIEDLKANVDAYLREVRAGECIVLCDGGAEVAELRPAGEEVDGLVVQWPTAAPESLLELAPVPLDDPTDVVKTLREDRDRP